MRLTMLMVLIAAEAAYGQAALSLQSRIDLSDVNGRIDHLSADVPGRRIFVSALGNRTVEVIDARAGKRIRTIGGLDEPQGLYYDSSTNRLFVASDGDGTVKVFDAGTFQLRQTAKFSSDADNLRYDARNHRILVGYGEGALGFLDSNGNKTGEIAVDAHPESFQLENTGTRLFVNVPGREEIEVADLAQGRILTRWPVTAARSNFPMALDEGHRRLLIGCRNPARMLVLDSETGKVAASIAIPGDTDDLFYDAARQRIYVIGGGGFVDAFERIGNDQYKRIAHVATAAGARTGLFVPEWKELFVAVPHRGERVAQLLVYATE